MGKEEVFRTIDQFSQQHPDIDSLSQANLPQVPEDEIDALQQKILFSVSGNYFQRVSPLIKKHFPQIIKDVQTQTRQVRLIAITDQDGSVSLFKLGTETNTVNLKTLKNALLNSSNFKTSSRMLL